MSDPDTEQEDQIPAGFDLENPEPEVYIIRHKRGGMGCMNLFLIVWLSGWTVGCVFLLHSYLNGGTMDDGSPMPLWFVAAFWAGEIGVAGLLAYLLFARKSYRLDVEKMIVETKVLLYRKRRLIRRDAIRRLVQVKDGGEGDDSFPSWGLKVEADKKTTLIFRQPHEKSRWLGGILAHWAGVEFDQVPED